MTFILSSVHMMKFINSHKEFWSPRNTATSEYKSPCRQLAEKEKKREETFLTCSVSIMLLSLGSGFLANFLNI